MSVAVAISGPPQLALGAFFFFLASSDTSLATALFRRGLSGMIPFRQREQILAEEFTAYAFASPTFHAVLADAGVDATLVSVCP